MSNVVHAYLNDQYGNCVGHPDTAYPKLATGQTVTCTTAGTNYTATVKSGKTYVVLAVVGNALFGFTGTVATAANIEWFCAKDHKALIHIPEASNGAATATLNMTGSVNSTIVYLVECKERA